MKSDKQLHSNKKNIPSNTNNSTRKDDSQELSKKKKKDNENDANLNHAYYIHDLLFLG